MSLLVYKEFFFYSQKSRSVSSMSKFDEISADVLVCLVSYVDGFLDVLSITLFF